MGWSIGYDEKWQRDIGYGVPCVCDSPKCNEVIDRGLAHVCGGEPHGGERGCGLYFCQAHHRRGSQSNLCLRCERNRAPYAPKEDSWPWVLLKLKDKSWEECRKENSEWMKINEAKRTAKRRKKPDTDKSFAMRNF